jgi:hypothetical protein
MSRLSGGRGLSRGGALVVAGPNPFNGNRIIHRLTSMKVIFDALLPSAELVS